jgi:hypothetical protein
MQSHLPCNQNVEPDAFTDEMTQARVRHLTERLTARIRAPTLLPEGVPREEIPHVRWGNNSDHAPALQRVPLVRWGDRANHHLGSQGARDCSAMQELHALLKARRYGDFRNELARAELAGEITEFYALNSHAILAVVEGSEFANDYLEMATAVASSPYELAVIAENRAAYDLLQGNPLAAAKHCLATLAQVYQTEGLWNNLLIALYRLGDVETIDAALRSFTLLTDECTARLVGLLSSEPDLREVHSRPAFRELLEKRAAEKAS